MGPGVAVPGGVSDPWGWELRDVSVGTWLGPGVVTGLFQPQCLRVPWQGVRRPPCMLCVGIWLN